MTATEPSPPRLGDVWVVAGPPGAGKSTASAALAALLQPPAAVLDKDVLHGRFVRAVLAAAGRPDAEREGPWYDRHVKPHEYGGLLDTARAVRRSGCPVVLDGPFTGQTHAVDRWRALVDDVGGPPVHLLWVRADPAGLAERLRARGRPQDAGKLADVPAWLRAVRAAEPPVVPHHVLDTRPGAAALPEQLRAALAQGPLRVTPPG